MPRKTTYTSINQAGIYTLGPENEYFQHTLELASDIMTQDETYFYFEHDCSSKHIYSTHFFYVGF